MPAVIIRNIDQTVLDRCTELADKKGISREEFLRRAIINLSVVGTVKEIESKYETLFQAVLDQSKMMNDIIDNNTFALNKFLEKI